MKKVWLFLAVLAFIGSAIFGWYYFAYQSFHDITTPYFARNWVKAELTDPASAQFRSQKGYCGEVNSKNRIGGKAMVPNRPNWLALAQAVKQAS